MAEPFLLGAIGTAVGAVAGAVVQLVRGKQAERAEIRQQGISRVDQLEARVDKMAERLDAAYERERQALSRAERAEHENLWFRKRVALLIGIIRVNKLPAAGIVIDLEEDPPALPPVPSLPALEAPKGDPTP